MGLLVAALLGANQVSGDDPARLEHFQFTDAKGAVRRVAARVLVEAQDGGLLLLGQDGRIWSVEPPQLKSRAATNDPFRPLSAAALGHHLVEELGAPAEIVTTRHYVMVTTAGKPYAQWCGQLFERLYAAFHNYWKQRGVKLHEPEFPLPAIILRNQAQFAEFAARDEGPDAATALGYFSIGSNRTVMYDLTAGAEGTAATPAEISRQLAAAPYNVATVVHEATHQIAFNSGLHTRYADNPLWLVEGMAMYFETPDLTSRAGWKTVGAVNDLRYKRFADFLAHRRAANSLQTLVQSDERLVAPDATGDTYAEAWALSYFLIKTRKEQYTTYLQRLAERPRLAWDTSEQRLAAFREAFGEDLAQLDAEFVRYMKRLK